MNILILDYDFETWSEARSYSYMGCHFLYEEILNYTNNVDIFLFGKRSNCEKNLSILKNIYEQGVAYDIVLVAMPHIKFDSSFLNLLEYLSKIVIFIHYESTVYTDIEINENPKLADRLVFMKSLRGKPYTHINFCWNSHQFFLEFGLHSKFSNGFIPKERQDYSISFDIDSKKTMFSNVIYNDQRNIFSSAIIKKMKNIGVELYFPIDNRNITKNFEKLMWLQLNQFFLGENIFALSKQILSVRKRIWLDYMSQLSASCAIFSLPSYFKGFPGRVMEASVLGIKSYVFKENYSPEFIKKFDKFDLVEFTDLQSLENFDQSKMSNKKVKDNLLSDYFDNPVDFILSNLRKL